MTSKSARLFTLLLAGCVAPAPSSSSSAPIVNGEPGGNPAVVVLQNFRNGGICTGTLIAERVVLTAKHCVQDPFAEGPVSPSAIGVGVGDNIRGLSSVLRVQSISTTPGIYTEDSRGSVGPELIGVDVAVLVLQSGASGVTPIPIRRESPDALAGTRITAIGFGQTPRGQVGVKYTAEGRVQYVDRDLLYVGPLICQGDSGGPAITADDEVAGVVSFGAGSCGSGYGAYNAIYPFLDMIDAALIEAGSCLNDGEERCDGADNDCDDQVDETCTPIGGACTRDDECVGLTCRETSGGRLCTSPCDPLRPEFGCEPGFYCARDQGCEGLCVPLAGARGELAIDAPCASDTECASLFCNDPGDGVRRCLQPCRGDAGTCLAGEACVANPDQCGACVPEASYPSDRGLGEGCAASDDCRSGLCYEDEGRSYCSRACTADADCASGFHCRDEVCAAGPRGDIGDRCLGNGDCANLTFCAMRGEQRWCSRICGESDPCPEGFSCVPAGGTHVCAPDSGLVGDACEAGDDCISGVCASESGTCSRECGPDAPCAVGLECRRDEDGAGALCLPPRVETAGGGCSVDRVGASRASVGTLALTGLALVWARRRRRSA